MRKIKAAIAGIVALFSSSCAMAPAFAQQFNTLPAHTVIGRIGATGDTGPSQAIPFANLASQIFNLAPVVPVYHPSSGNLNGAGCTTSSTTFWNVAENICGTADVWQISSSDPSASFSLTLSGTVTVGDSISLTITMGSGNCSGAGCTVTSGAATGGDTLQSLANKLVCAIANNASLFNLNGGSCIGAAGVVSGTQTYGGYTGGYPIGYTVLITNGIAFDFNSNISLKVTSAVSGGATEIVTIANTNCAVRCSYSLDNNPAIQMVRNTGSAPQPGSVIGAIYAIGSSSACPTGVCINYGSITNWVANSTSASLKSAWLLQTPNTSGAASGGFWFGQGAYANSGGSPFSSTALQDKGTGTLNLGTCLWFNSTSARDATITDKICQDSGSGQLQIVTTGADNIILSSPAGVGVNTTPTGNTFTSSLGGFFSGSQTPTTGSGVSLAFSGGNGAVTSKNYGTAAYQQLILQGAPIQLAPSGVGAQGVNATSNEFYPTTDNQVLLGDTATPHRWASVASMSYLFGGATSGNITMTAPAIAGTGTLTLPARTGTVAINATATVQLFTSGTNATYTTPANVTWIEIETVGGGGGGAGSGTTPGAATAGGNTCWNTSGTACTTAVYQAAGGTLGATGGGTAAGGAVSGTSTCNDSQAGNSGGPASGVASSPGGLGGGTRYGQGGMGGTAAAAASVTVAANTGAGGGGAGVNATANSGGGGGGGAWCYAIITAPAATYVYTVGTAGAAGTAGTSGFAGAAGSAGKVRVIEHYN